MNIMQAKLNTKKEIKTEELEQKDSSYFIQLKKQIFLIIIITLGTLLSKIKKSATFPTNNTNEKGNKKYNKWYKNNTIMAYIIVLGLIIVLIYKGTLIIILVNIK